MELRKKAEPVDAADFAATLFLAREILTKRKNNMTGRKENVSEAITTTCTTCTTSPCLLTPVWALFLAQLRSSSEVGVTNQHNSTHFLSRVYSERFQREYGLLMCRKEMAYIQNSKRKKKITHVRLIVTLNVG